jgi:predicted RNase H-like nuclease (RuvC/YqgF family)
LEEEREKFKQEKEREKEHLEQIIIAKDEKFKQEMEREKEHLEQIIIAKDETITTLKEKFDSVEALKDFNRKPSTVQKWGESTPVFCF